MVCCIVFNREKFWRFILQLLLYFSTIIDILHASKCSIDNIKNGYSLKFGTKSSNVQLLGRALNLNGCKQLCCDTDKYKYGLFDGFKCYGITCDGISDHKCTLTEDGNAEYSLFALKPKSYKDVSKQHHKKKEKIHWDKLNSEDIHISIKTQRENNKNKLTNLFYSNVKTKDNKTNFKQFHRKHKNRRKNKLPQSKNITHNRYSRDYPYLYFKNLTPVSQLQKRTVLPDYKSYSYNTDINNPKTRYKLPTSYQQSWYNYYTQSYKNNILTPLGASNRGLYGSINQHSQLNDDNLPKHPKVSMTETTLPKYKLEFDIMSTSELNKGTTNSLQKPMKLSSKSWIDSSQSHERNEVKPLSEFPEDPDSHSIVEKNAIPRPEQLTKEQEITTKDSSIDIPFSSSSKLSQPSSNYLQGNIQSSRRTSSIDGKQHKISSQIYSMLFPLSTIQRQTYQKLFLQRCINPLGISKSSIIPNENMAATSEMIGFPAENGRLQSTQNNTRSWCASPNSTFNGDEQQLMIDFGKQSMFCRIGTQGNSAQKKWVEKFKLQFSDDGKIWEPYSENGIEKVFFSNKDEKDTTYQTLKNPILSRYVRFQPVVWIGDVPCLRVELFNTSLKKDSTEISTRSEIPIVTDGIIEDLGFEKMDGAVALDSSRFGNNGFLYGGSTVVDTHSSCRHGIQIPPGGDIVFDGTVMKTYPRQAITISIWVKLEKVEGVHSIFDTVGSHSNHNLGQFHFEVVGGDVRWFHRNETEDVIFNVITTKKLIKPNEWNHLVATYDANTHDAIIYINGTEQVRGLGYGLISKDWSERVGIGRHKGARFLHGKVDEFLLYNKALNKDQIAQLYDKCDFSKYYCGSTLTENTGTIVSPSYPSTFVGPVECTWNIHGLPGEVIVIDMKQFRLGKGDSCGKANLEIRDGINDSVIGNYCSAASTPRKIFSHSNRMYLKYVTTGSMEGEMFKLEYYREKKRTTKKTLPERCEISKNLENVTLVHGVHSGNFTELGPTADMKECKSRCCDMEGCDVAFLIDNNCYSVKCVSKETCRVREAKPSKLNPQLAFVRLGNREWISEPNIERRKNENLQINNKSTSTCEHQPILENMTLAGGIQSGNFTSQGIVGNMNDCIQYCCEKNDCDVAFMVKRTCFSLDCKNDRLCESRPAKPSSFHPMLSYMKRYKTGTTMTGVAKTEISASEQKDDEGPSTCKEMRISKVFHDVTLNGGISSGDFTDKGHVSSMDECVSKCCDVETCNVAFVIKDTCFLVKCKSYENCGLKSAVSKYYNPKIAYINWSPPKDNLDESASYIYKGCWRDFDITAFAMPLLEGTDEKLNEPYKKRSDPVNTCAKVSQDLGYKVFAVQNGGACFSGPEAEETFKRYGKSDDCKAGKGGPFANSVYKSFEDGSIISLGCWSDLKDRAFRRMEKNDPILKDNYQQRSDPVSSCAKVAEKMQKQYFALQKGGQCFVAKSPDIKYDKYSPSRKCKYGLGGQMANDVYMLKKNFSSDGNAEKGITLQSLENHTGSEPRESSLTNNRTTLPNELLSKDDLDVGEMLYKEELEGPYLVRYLYKADPPISNVTLTSAINAGTFVDKGKMNSIDECIKKCGESSDCNVAFMLSSQCFSVHCFSEDTCKTKPAFSSFYNPQLAFVKHRVIRDHKENNTSIRTINESCKVRSELSNVTFIEGIKAGDFTDIGHVVNFDECKLKCCQDNKCHIAFKIQNDCYGVSCFSRETCKTRPAKNADLFQPEMALLRPVKESIEQKNSNSVVSGRSEPSKISNDDVTNATMRATQPKKLLSKCESNDLESDDIIFNRTLIGGINSGDFREHGRTENMKECVNHCCLEEDCDLSFMIDHDCYTVKCAKPELCKTRAAKTTSFVPQIVFKRKMEFGIDEAIEFVKDTLTELTLDKENIARPFKVLYKGLKATATLPTVTPLLTPSTHVKYKTFDETNVFDTRKNEHSRPSINNASITAHSEPDGLATPMLEDPKKHSCEAGKIIHNATLRLGMHSGQFTKIGHVKSMDDCIESCCRSSNADVAYMLGQFCFAVRCKTKEMCKPSPAMYSDIKSLNLNPAISFLNKGKVPDVFPDDDLDILASTYNKSIDSDDVIRWIIRNMTTTLLQTSNKLLRTSENHRHYGTDDDKLGLGNNREGITSNDEGTCSDSPITYNVTLRGGIHSGKFTDLGGGIDMRECVGRCCNTPLCDVAFMFSDKCYAVGCYDESKCQAVIAKPSSLNPKLAYVSKYRSSTGLAANGIGFKVEDDSVCSTSNLLHGPVYTNRTLLGGMKAGNFSYLGQARDIHSCLSKCCSNDGCDLAYLVNKDQCFSVKCFSPELCQVTDKLLNNRMIEISKLIKPRKKRKIDRGTIAAYFAIGLLTSVIGFSGFLWAVMIFVKRKKMRTEGTKRSDGDIPRSDSHK